MKGLKQKRKAQKLTLEDIAKQIGVSFSAVSLWERGERFPRKPMLEKLCNLFSCNIDELL